MNAKNHFLEFVLFLFLFIPAMDNSLIAGGKAGLGTNASQPDYQENNNSPNFRIAPITTSPRVIISTDIGGSDPDDFQSMIHFLMYADRFETEGLIASPYGKGRKSDILHMLDLYEKDYPRLKSQSEKFPSADELRLVAKQGAIERAPGKGWSRPSEGSDWIITCAQKKDTRPLWVLVWGGLEDVAQALHDAPEIENRLRIYWIGGPNKKWAANSYQYLVSNFPDLWMIEANATYRGWFVGGEQEGKLGNQSFYEAHIRGKGALGEAFGDYYGGNIKMGDTPSVAYFLYGDPDRPESSSWGGSFELLSHSSRRIFERETSLADQVPVFGLIEWVIEGPDQSISGDEACLWMEIEGQQFDGYYEGDGRYRIRFVPKKAGEWSYRISSPIAELDGREGQFTSTDPWPGALHEHDIVGLKQWWSDHQSPETYEGVHQGARTVSQWREGYLLDWAERWSWLTEGAAEKESGQ